MVFNSLKFLVFYAIVFVLFFALQPRHRWVLLLAASYFFYMSWNPAYILLLIFSTVFDYWVSQKIYNEPEQRRKRKFLVASIVVNLGLLFVFKYYNFFNDSVAAVMAYFQMPYDPVLSSLLLPVGISFYTFQSLSYNTDVYRGKQIPEKHLGIFAAYISFFPQLVAGPIERAKNLLPQIQKNDSKLDYQNFKAGLLQLLWGLFKKAVVADTAAIYVNSVYNNHDFYTGSTLVIATWLFAIQIYCDFSGYSDMALGCARMLGYNLMENFRLPYFSKNVTEFWRRWHISLSTWLRDYLYIPLGGSRSGSTFLTMKNLMLTMLLGGLWHGASWNFVIWGALNGAYLAIERLLNWKNLNFNKNLLTRSASIFLTFNLICLTWIFFRAQTFDQAWYIVSEIFASRNFFDFRVIDTSVFANIAVGVSVLLLFEIFLFRNHSFRCLGRDWSVSKATVFSAMMLFLVIFWGVSEGSQFIYFQF